MSQRGQFRLDVRAIFLTMRTIQKQNGLSKVLDSFSKKKSNDQMSTYFSRDSFRYELN